MAKEGQGFEQWLRGAKVQPEQLNDQQRAVLQAAFSFLQPSGGDYSSSRIAGYFLLHCNSGLKVAQIARLVGISTRSASRHRKLSARQVVQQIQQRFNGRPYGKLLLRHAGSIAEFLFTHPEATRDDLLDFIEPRGNSASPRWPCGSFSRSAAWTVAPWRKSGKLLPERKWKAWRPRCSMRMRRVGSCP